MAVCHDGNARYYIFGNHTKTTPGEFALRGSFLLGVWIRLAQSQNRQLFACAPFLCTELLSAYGLSD